MIKTRLSSHGKWAFFPHFPSEIGFCRYVIIILLSLLIVSNVLFPSATAADIVIDTNRTISPPFDNESSGTTNFTITPTSADTIFDSDLSMYPPVAEDNTDEINLTATTYAENKTYAYNLVDKGIDCYNSGNFACSFASFEAAQVILPDDINILYIQAQALSLQKHYDEALNKIDAGIALKPDSPELWSQKGIILNNMGKYFESGSCFDRVAELEPGYEFPITDRFPVNILIKNSTFLVLAIGFCALGCVFYLKEIRQ